MAEESHPMEKLPLDVIEDYIAPALERKDRLALGRSKKIYSKVPAEEGILRIETGTDFKRLSDHIKFFSDNVFPRLKMLEISAEGLIHFLWPLPQLICLYIIPDDDEVAEESLVEFLQFSPKLKCLDAKYCNVSAAILGNHANTLEYLHCHECFDYQALVTCPHLKYLSIERFPEPAFPLITSSRFAPSLKYLNITIWDRDAGHSLENDLRLLLETCGNLRVLTITSNHESIATIFRLLESERYLPHLNALSLTFASDAILHGSLALLIKFLQHREIKSLILSGFVWPSETLMELMKLRGSLVFYHFEDGPHAFWSCLDGVYDVEGFYRPIFVGGEKGVRYQFSISGMSGRGFPDLIGFDKYFDF